MGSGDGRVKLSGTGFFSTPLVTCHFMASYGSNATTPGTFNDMDSSVSCPYPALNDVGMGLEGLDLEDVPALASGWEIYLQVAMNGQQYSPAGQTFKYFAQRVDISTVTPPFGPKSGGMASLVTSLWKVSNASLVRLVPFRPWIYYRTG